MGLAGLILGWVLDQADGPALWGLLSGCRPIPLAHAWVLFTAAAFTSGLAWSWVLRPLGVRLSLFESFRLSMVGFLLNNLIPSGLGGDLYRGVALARAGAPGPLTAASVLVERWSALLALWVATLASFALALPLLREVRAGPELGRLWPPLGALRLDLLVGGLLVALGLGLLAGTWGGLGLIRGRRWPWLEARLGGSAGAAFREALEVSRAHPRAFFGAALINLASPLLEGLAFSSIADGLGLALSPLLFLAFTPIFRVLNHLPLSVNAVGTQEVASLVFWVSLGATREEALAISLWIHGLKVGVSALGVPLHLLGGPVRVERLDRRGAG